MARVALPWKLKEGAHRKPHVDSCLRLSALLSGVLVKDAVTGR